MNTIFPQVTIKEKVAIDPRGLRLNSVNHSIKFIYEWSMYPGPGGIIPPPAPGGISVTNSCGQSSYGEGEGHAEATIPNAKPGNYTYVLSRPSGVCGESITAWDENGNELYRDVSGNPGCIANINGTVPFNYFNVFTVGRTKDSILYPANPVSNELPWNYAAKNWVYDIPSSDCNGDIDLSVDPITYTITQGGEYAMFYDYWGNSLGTSATGGGIYVGTNCNIPTQEVQVVVEGRAGNVVSITSFKIIPPAELKLSFHDSRIDTMIYPGWENRLSASTPAQWDCATYTYEIIKGSEWGTLHEYGFEGRSDRDGKILNDVYVSEGELFSVNFRAWDEVPTQIETLQVRVSASDPRIIPDTVQFFIGPGLRVTATPAVLTYGQTSLIDAKLLLADGSTAPLSPNAYLWFYIANWDGMDAGTLQSPSGSPMGDDIDGIFQHVTFIAQEETPQPDSVTVYIYAEVWDDGTGYSPDPPLSGIVKVVVRKGCSGFPECNINPTPPAIAISNLTSNDLPSECSDAQTMFGDASDPAVRFRVLGWFKPLQDKDGGVDDNFSPVACYNNQTNSWNFSVPQINFKAFLDLCPYNLVLNTFSQGKQIVDNIPESSCYIGCEDIKGHYFYPPRVMKYYLNPVLRKHEEIHKRDYERAIAFCKSKFDTKFQEFQTELTCNGADNIAEVVNYAKIQIADMARKLLHETSEK